jgi:hypothetical protein
MFCPCTVYLRQSAIYCTILNAFTKCTAIKRPNYKRTLFLSPLLRYFHFFTEFKEKDIEKEAYYIYQTPPPEDAAIYFHFSRAQKQKNRVLWQMSYGFNWMWRRRKKEVQNENPQQQLSIWGWWAQIRTHTSILLHRLFQGSCYFCNRTINIVVLSDNLVSLINEE